MEAKVINLNQDPSRESAARVEESIFGHCKDLAKWQTKLKALKLAQKAGQDCTGLITIVEQQIIWHEDSIAWWERSKTGGNNGSDLIVTWKRKMT